ncbi:S8 family peptidase [Streptomyces justiciae]|uniref:S8 family peptidase n=1 Tax=Streptomyces justiciae TaxID=2780140 RepID=UPI0021176374|nr:S8 family peptidase [Streptomyces justiciae]MCW8383702.1 S8 family peptidase [Streptomyces justiciae]
MRHLRLLTTLTASVALLTPAVTPSSAAPTAPPQGTAAARPASTEATVHLITGDRVTVAKGPDGHQTAAIRPGPGRDGIVFHTFEQDGHLTVLPSDAASLVSQGRLDRALFDVTNLLAQGYDDAHTHALPLIVATPGGTAERTADRLTAFAEPGSPSRELPSIDAHSLHVAQADLGRFWTQLARTDAKLKRAAVPRVWLDGRVHAVLDRSTAQIGAPAVWQTGARGQGVKVAILDTGVDQTHPDLAGRVTKTANFSDSATTDDPYGHGTHVASIVGGSGAASSGTRKGVAPEADLLVGKVLGDNGSGSESQVIDGMEWAAAQGAKVINMSLGSDQPSDGSDVMSQAVNELSRTTSALFVIAAGNSGRDGASTVGSPGAAESALTVGAVDRDDSLADFSSRGPRVGDGAVKPDVTAPGVGIVAARAASTTEGDVVDQYYVAYSGTSMATPHVAGAAALVAQRHPDWTGRRLKDALVSTARTITGQQVTEQGGGRVDAPAAALGTLTATGTLTPGPFQLTDPARTFDLTYTNTSDQAITLNLAPRLTNTAGRPAPPDALRLAATVTVPAHGTTTVPLTTDPARTGQGTYYGYIIATPTDAAVAPVHTTLCLIVHGPIHRLTVRTYDEHGTRVPAQPLIWGPAGFVPYSDPEHGIAEVEEGTYQVSHSSLSTAEDGQELREVVLPEVNVTKDTTVTVDARKTVPVEIRTPRPAEQRGVLSYQTYRELDGHALVQGTMFFDIAKRLYVSPTAQVHNGTFEFASRWQLVAPLLQARATGLPDPLNAYYMPNSPLFSDRGTTLRAVNAGDAAAPQLGGLRGRLAVLTDQQGTGTDQALRQIAAAGAKGVLLIHFDDSPWTRWTPDGDRSPLPVIRVGATTGAKILTRIHHRTTELTFRGTARSPYLYDVMQVARQQIPQHVVHTVTARDSAVLHTTYADNGGSGWAAEQRFARRPYQQTAWLQYNRYVPTGITRTEYVGAGDTTWQHLVHHTTVYDPDVPLSLGMRDTPHTYRAGTTAKEIWQGSVVRPSIPVNATEPTARQGNVMRLRIPEFTDSQPGHWSRYLPDDGGGIDTRTTEASQDTVTAALYRDGTELTDLNTAWTDVEVPTAPANYRLELHTSRTSPDWDYATRTATTWFFRSSPTEKPTALPLLQLDYAVPVDAHNTVTGSGYYGVIITARAQNGAPTPHHPKMRVEISYDDGRTWCTTNLRNHGRNTFRATLNRPPHNGDTAYATVRVTAQDTAGKSIQQTVHRAWAVRG